MDRLRLEIATLDNPHSDISARYIAATSLNRFSSTLASAEDVGIIEVLQSILNDASLSDYRQSYFIFREAAQALASIFGRLRGEEAGFAAYAVLQDALHDASGAAHRAVCEAMGRLPCRIPQPVTPSQKQTTDAAPMPIDLAELLARTGKRKTAGGRFAGRCLVVPCDDGNCLVLKFLRTGESVTDLVREVIWQEYCRKNFSDLPVFCEIPAPIVQQGHRLFAVDLSASGAFSGPAPSAVETLAVGYFVGKDYFLYSNHPRSGTLLDGESFLRTMGNSARLLGCFTGRGVIHTAPVPLFHNRVQQERRNDNGIYDWPRGGRLDQWLSSCAYPNFGLSGLRDFEHLELFDGNRGRLYWYMGSHLLGLLLVCASYFRNKAPDKIGYDAGGKPYDTREYFDTRLLRQLVEEIFRQYYQGFCTSAFTGALPFDGDRLVCRMIEEMGVDNHMEEILRTVDQDEMDLEEFRRFLRQRGYTEQQTLLFDKGRADIIILTGPHLGDFNDRISLPELTETVAAMAASCMAGRFNIENVQ